MTETLGKIEKPEASFFASKRKLYVVTLLFSGAEAPAEYVEKFNQYWQQVREHLVKLESKIGKPTHIYHESVALAGDEGLKILEKLNPASCRIARDKCQNGAQLEAVEDKELADESIDWERHLFVGFISQKVARTVSEYYLDVTRKRYEHIARRIDETLKSGEVGILFIREGHLVQFPTDIEVFSIAPPVLDEIRRWQRNQATVEDEADASTENSP